MDTRGQGSAWRKGDTPDPERRRCDRRAPGFMTRGDRRCPHSYYYRRVFTDAVRAVEAARSAPGVDAARIVDHRRQPGRRHLAGRGRPGRDVAATMPDVPFLCHYRRATEITDAHPYREIVALSARSTATRSSRSSTTLSYFDGVNFARRATAPAAVLGRPDGRDLPAVDGVRRLQPLRRPEGDRASGPFNHHEGGGTLQVNAKLAFLADLG